MKPEQLIHRYLIGEATEEEVASLDRLLAGDPALRRKLILEARNDAGLREIALERASQDRADSGQKVIKPVFWRFMEGIAVAAVVAILGVIVWDARSSSAVVATLVSSEEASWESSLPTSPGSKLTAGYLNLTSGMATIRFRSGAEVILEAPANLVLETPMRGRLLKGAAVIDVPEEAIGFVMETPNGYAVDYGTRFAISVDGESENSSFEVLEGEIKVHHPGTGDEVSLSGRQSSTIDESGLVKIDGPLPERTLAQSADRKRLASLSGAFSLVGNDEDQYLHPDFLMAKRSLSKTTFDRRSVFSFDLSGIDLGAFEGAKVRLNLVPSGIGFAAHLPVVNRFLVYGRKRSPLDTADANPTWATAFQPFEGELLGSFEIPRSLKRGTFEIDTPELSRFLRSNAGGEVSFLLVRDTSERENGGLVHTFASNSHPEASGPTLEFYQKPNSDHDSNE